MSLTGILREAIFLLDGGELAVAGDLVLYFKVNLAGIPSAPALERMARVKRVKDHEFGTYMFAHIIPDNIRLISSPTSRIVFSISLLPRSNFHCRMIFCRVVSDSPGPKLWTFLFSRSSSS